MNRILALLVVIVLCSGAVGAQTDPTERKLNETIDRVIQKQQYQWRLPRGSFEPPKDGFMNLAFQKLNRYFITFFKTVSRWIREIRDWLDRKFFKGQSPSSKGRFSGNEKTLLYLLGAIAAALILLFFLKFRKKQKSAQTIAAQAVVPIPDLSRDDVLASQLPEDEWMKLARELAASGNLRLAMRALYMAGLASLASRELITIAKFKSNREYQLELQRRAHSYPKVIHSFSENVSLLERSWYGDHPVTNENFDRFRLNQEQLRKEVAI